MKNCQQYSLSMDKKDIEMKSSTIEISNDLSNEIDLELSVQLALNETGFGKFNLKVMVLCCLIYLNTALSICSIGFILPSAACDFHMSTIDKGNINIISLIGMAAGCWFWGCYAGIKGRIRTLKMSLFLQGIFEFLSGIIPNYGLFLLFKFLSGFSLSGQSGTLFVYLVIGWLIIPLQFEIDAKPFTFHSWNLFVIICSLPSFTIGFWSLYFNESPKFLAENMQLSELSVVLRKIYTENTGNPIEMYFEILDKNKNPFYDNLKINNNHNNSNDNTKVKSWRTIIYTTYIQTISLFKFPYLFKSLNVFILISCITASYYTLMLWFPELFQRFAKYEQMYPEKSSSVCEISKINLIDNNNTMVVEYDIYDCQNNIHDNVFFHTLLLGLGCLPLSIILPLTVTYTGYKIYIIICTFLSTLVTIGFFFITSSTQNLILSSIFEALTSVCMSITLCIVVDIFPTNLRMMAASLAAFCARVGAFSGNWIFGYLIDNYCLSLIIIVASQLFFCTILSFLTPGRFGMIKPTKII
ncbi:PREDICTED: synaptic vesicle glycoprotein 2C-like isoform X2 [Polistes dominula]|uniref:Synaptic vesicle glycoprotein 2C-like isoform X2 n=1 Tax=Polistes dominula TaxID=743375 RepID=A0ABM1IFK1_POLDO|nr:PREDICTED: synaptic vesicle glycoprotein 2C-like isoform X2 [Polistes dominula]